MFSNEIRSSSHPRPSEAAVHGVKPDSVVTVMSPSDMPDGVLAKIRHICAGHNFELGFVR